MRWAKKKVSQWLGRYERRPCPVATHRTTFWRGGSYSNHRLPRSEWLFWKRLFYVTLYEPHKRFTLKMYSDVRDGFIWITNIRTVLNNPLYFQSNALRISMTQITVQSHQRSVGTCSFHPLPCQQPQQASLNRRYLHASHPHTHSVNLTRPQDVPGASSLLRSTNRYNHLSSISFRIQADRRIHG